MPISSTFRSWTSSGPKLCVEGPTGALTQSPGAASFAGKNITAILPHGADPYVVVTKKHGLFRCRLNATGGTSPEQTSPEPVCIRFNSGLTDLLRELQPNQATMLPDESFAISTARGGLVDEKLVERSAELGAYALERLRKLGSKHVKELRGRGLWIGIELHPES